MRTSSLEQPHTRLIEREAQYYDDRAHGLLEVLADGAPSTLAQVRSWHPAFAEASDERIQSAATTGQFTQDDARLVYAREHGFASWELLAEHLRRLEAGEIEEPFVKLIEAGKAGDWASVTSILSAHPEFVHARGTNGNTLLNLACSLVECVAPDASAGNADEGRLGAVRLLLSAGANPNQGNDRGWTPLHQAGYRNDPEMVALLLDGGARFDVEAHGAGGTPLAVALFWGHREASDLLARSGIVPRNLRVAAGLGRTDLIEECFTPDGRLTAAARSARGFYRPHSGFPFWKPSDDSQEVIDEALVWAAKSDRVEVMPLLVERGANIAADLYRGTPLLWAAGNGRVRAVTWLLQHGVDVNSRATFGGMSHGKDVTALHLAAQDGDLAMVKLLVRSGGDPTIQDAIYHSSPAGWATHFGATEVAAYLLGLTR
ncbi:MAG: ankyrin repeat domain-containing protein [Gemmatimonadaceae bacterium]|nr:ankyrin repeat domain-containing protein [Gemmatimonadaceae bacterium]MDQ3519754.1 ankyrin repeat domain-containing protein [Gemmatimonadota bacterium]